MILQEISDLVAAFPNACRTYRRRAGRTAAEVADETGLTETIISRFERGDTKIPSAYNIIAYAKAISFSLDDYFQIVDHDSPAADIVELRTSVKYLEKQVADRDSVIRSLTRSRNIVFMCSFVLLLMIISGLIIIDLYNPAFGLFWRS